MLEDSPKTISHFLNAQVFRQGFRLPILLFSFSGLKWGKMRHENTKEETYLPQYPYICMALPGIEYEFEYSDKRDSWAVFFNENTAFLLCDNSFDFKILYSGHELTFPIIKRIPQEKMLFWEKKLQQLQDWLRSPLPENRFLSALWMADVLQEFGNEPEKQKENLSPAEKLKKEIDSDTNFSQTLDSLSLRAGYCRDHARRLFITEYSISPGNYRTRKRLSRIMEYITNTRLSIKEIALATGFRNVAHMYPVFQKNFDITPAEAIRKYRQM